MDRDLENIIAAACLSVHLRATKDGGQCVAATHSEPATFAASPAVAELLARVESLQAGPSPAAHSTAAAAAVVAAQQQYVADLAGAHFSCAFAEPASARRCDRAALAAYLFRAAAADPLHVLPRLERRLTEAVAARASS